MNDIVTNIKIGENSYAYLIDKEGTTIADEDPNAVGVENSIKESETDKSLLSFAEADEKAYFRRNRIF